jgi:hypothetical protein
MSKSASAKTGKLIWGKQVIVLQPTPLPVVYFDHAPTFSYLNGVIGITLTGTGNVPTETGGIEMVAAVVAHVKCNVPAARALRDALNGALLLAEPVENPQGPSN